MNLLLDENLSPRLAQALALLGKNAVHLTVCEGMHRGMPDIDWIPIAGQRGMCVLTQDGRQIRNPAEYHLHQRHRVGLFILNGKDPSLMKLALTILTQYEAMERIADSAPRPFVYLMNFNGRGRPKPLH